MGEDKKKFRFLNDAEYFSLPAEKRGEYLSAAAEALQWRQEQLRRLVQEMVKENRPKRH